MEVAERADGRESIDLAGNELADPRLAELLGEIELRTAVELAKLGELDKI